MSHLGKSQGQLVGVIYMSQHQNSELESGTVTGYLLHLFCDAGGGVCNPFSVRSGPHMEY